MSDTKLQTTTIGAYPKPACTPIRDWFPDPDDDAAKQPGEGLLKRWERAGYEAGLEEAGDEAEGKFIAAIEEVVHDQVEAGIDVPTDGEVRRENYIFYQCRHMNGFDFEHLTEKVAREGAFTAQVPTITGPVSMREPVLARDWRIAQAVTGNPVKITLPGPMTITDSLANNYYPDARAQGAALAEALNAEVLDLAAAGCRYIQVDEPVFARKPELALEYGIEHLERVFHGVPEHVQRVVHMCCGYPNALDVTHYLKADPKAYFQIADAMDEAAIDAVSIEDAHRHNDLSLLEHYRKTTVLLGVIAIAKSTVEEVDEVKERLEQALSHIDSNRLVAAPDCGLGLLGRDLARKKLKQLSTAARCVHA